MLSTAHGNDDAAEDGDTLCVPLTHHGHKHILHLPNAAAVTIATLSAAIAAQLSIPTAHQKLLITPKPGLLKPPFTHDHDGRGAGALLLAPLVAANCKIVLIGNTLAELSSLQRHVSHAAAQHVARENHVYPIAPATPVRSVGSQMRTITSATATIHSLQPLEYLPHPEHSLKLLKRLCDDPGVQAAMRRHSLSVGLLTEMDPAAHTTAHGRTLGLNRNRGEVIELRLRTDASDGYRDYRTIRRTLCHELAHNVWGEHDRNFWDLCKEIEREVERNDWRSGGRSVGSIHGDRVYESVRVDDDDDVALEQGHVFDHGGWTGGDFVLGGRAASVIEGNPGTAMTETVGAWTRRQIMARAAEERASRARQEKDKG